MWRGREHVALNIFNQDVSKASKHGSNYHQAQAHCRQGGGDGQRKLGLNGNMPNYKLQRRQEYQPEIWWCL